MAAILPAVFLVLCWLGFASTDGWRPALVKAAILFGVTVTADTELLALPGLLEAPAVSAVWVAECLGAGLLVWRRRELVVARLRDVRAVRPPRQAWLAALPLGFILLATGVTAAVAPPNTYDSMAYHMARVAHWIADTSLAPYPTNILRQLFEPPWSEYAILQLQILSAGDGLANLVQWFAMVGSLAAVSLIARRLGAPPRGQVLAAIAVATLPMGILQSSSTQTDYVEAFWLLCTVWTALAFADSPSPGAAGWFAGALGLAALTKGTAYLFAAPVVVGLGVWMIVRLRQRMLVPAAIMVAVPLLIGSGQYIRNLEVFGNPLSDNADSQILANATFAPNAVVSNIVRDAVLQFGTPSSAANGLLARAVSAVHNHVLHISVDDPRTTYPQISFVVIPMSLDEDYAGDPLQALLAVIAIVAAAAMAFRGGSRLPGLYAAALLLAYALFAGYLRWQPWDARLELPLLVLAGPLIGLVVSRMRWGTPIGIALAALLLVAAMPWTLDNASRPLVGYAIPHEARYIPAGQTIFSTSRLDLYFAKRHELEGPYSHAVALATASSCRNIGLWTGAADWEYPLWVLGDMSGHDIRVTQVMVQNVSAHESQPGNPPCLLVVVVPDRPDAISIDSVAFTKVYDENGVGIYGPA